MKNVFGVEAFQTSHHPLGNDDADPKIKRGLKRTGLGNSESSEFVES